MIIPKIAESKVPNTLSRTDKSDSSKKIVAVAHRTLPIPIPTTTSSSSTAICDPFASYKSTLSDAAEYTGLDQYFGGNRLLTEKAFQGILGWEAKIDAMASSFKSGISDQSGITVESIELPGSSVESASELGSCDWEFVECKDPT